MLLSSSISAVSEQWDESSFDGIPVGDPGNFDESLKGS